MPSVGLSAPRDRFDVEILAKVLSGISGISDVFDGGSPYDANAFKSEVNST